MAAVHTLAISNDGQVIACGGTEGVKFWNLQSQREIPSNSPQEAYGAVTCTTWITTKYSAVETLCSGTSQGYLVFLRPNPVDKHYQELCARRIGSGLEITCVAWDSSAHSDGGPRIAAGMRDNGIHIFSLNANSQLQAIFAGRLENTVPKSVAFADHKMIYIFGLFDGSIIKMNTIDGDILSEHHCETVIGCAATSIRKGLVVIDNATNGFTLYRLEGPMRGPMRTFITDPPKIRVPKQVAFGEDCKIVAGGSDNGSVYIFERKSGRLLETLQHAKDGLVQSISVRDVDAKCIIASGSPAVDGRKATINVWSCEFKGKDAPTNVPTNPTNTFTWVFRILVLALSIVLLVAACSRTTPQPVRIEELREWLTLQQISDWSSRLRGAQTVMTSQSPLTKPTPNSPIECIAPGQDMDLLLRFAERFLDLAREADSSVFVTDPHDGKKKELIGSQTNEIATTGVIYL